MKEKASARTEKKFQAWWNQTFFETHRPYYKSYKEIYIAGADLDYISFLHRRLENVDTIDRVERQKFKELRKDKKRKDNSELPPHIRELFVECVTQYIRGFIDGARKTNPTDPLSSIKTFPPLFPPLTPPDILFSARMRALANQAAQRFFQWIPKWLDDKEKEVRKTEDAELKSYFKENPIAEVFYKYVPPPWKYGKGGRQDLRGSFFLLAVTEHLHRKKDCYLLAARLLKAIRGQGFATGYHDRTTGYHDRTNAKARVHNLKKSFKSKWKSHLRAMRKFYLGLQASRAS